MSLQLHSLLAEPQILGAIGGTVVAADATGRVVYSNPAADRLYRVEAGGLLGRRLTDLVARTADDETRGIRDQVRGGATWSGVLPVRRDDGSTSAQHVTLSPLVDSVGSVVGVVGIGQEIPQGTAAGQARIDDERFRQVFDESPVAMGLVGTDRRIEQVNAALARLLGYSIDELAGATLDVISHPEDLVEDMAHLDRLLAGELGSYQMQKRFRRKDGVEVIGRLTATMVRDRHGGPRYAIGTVEDLTATLGAFNTIQQQKERMAATLRAAEVCSWELDLATLCQQVSDNYAEVLGIPFDMVPTTFEEVLELVHPDDQALFLDPSPDPDAVSDGFDVEFRMVRPQGDVVWVGCRGRFVRDDQGEPVALHGIMSNLTEQRTVEIRRVAAEERYRHTVEAANDAFVGVDGAGRICEWNAAAEQMSGWPAGEALGQPFLTLLVPADRRVRYEAALAGWAEDILAGRTPTNRWEITVQHRDGHTFPVEMSSIPEIEDGQVHLRTFVRDISARRERERDLAERATTDSLTGLANRTVVRERLETAIRTLRSPAAVGVLFIDVDHFKDVNDRLGHEAGDRLLVILAQRLRSAVRPTDTVGRMGGDEFVVICSDLTTAGDAELLADRILTDTQDPFDLGSHHEPVSVSIGIATTTDRTAPPEAVLRGADFAMYDAKRAGTGHAR